MFSKTYVGGCKSIWKMRDFANVASSCKASPKITKYWFLDLWDDSSRYIAPFPSEGSILLFKDDLSEGLIIDPTLIDIWNYRPSSPLLTFLP